jgi:hypothetical protein
MHYLKTYPESIGISHYLCWRMKQMKAEEVEFYWPQIWQVSTVVCPRASSKLNRTFPWQSSLDHSADRIERARELRGGKGRGEHTLGDAGEPALRVGISIFSCS